MSDENEEKPVEQQETIMMDFPKVGKIEEGKRFSPPVWEVRTFTDLQSKEVLHFTRVPTADSILQAPLEFFRGRANLQFSPQRPGMPPPPPQQIIFDFPEEKTIEECFRGFEVRMEERVAKMRQAAAERNRIISAHNMPKNIPGK